uniref:MAK10-like protein n=1 Tax=Tanacetum cinerariifolium TaxID=118510 RepID=A0A6L2N8U2_TANCI|nr:hypothetical protein [Tanacetum cinerariifolium]
MGDANPSRTLRDYSKPSHEDYKNTIELPIGNNVVPLRFDTIRLVQNGCSFYGLRSKDLNQHLKDFLKLVDSLDLDNENKERTIKSNARSSSCSDATCSSERNHFFIRNLQWSPQYCMENPKQAFVEYASSHTNKAGVLDKYVKSLELGKNGLAFVQGEVSVKIEDPGLFTLPCRLGDSKPFDTLAYLGSCVNIIPLYLFKTLNIILLEETDHIFGLAGRTKSYPVGIIKDVEVCIGKLKLLNDFYIIDMKKDPKTPLLVGRGFLATANVVIDCRKAKIAVGEGITRSVFGVKGVDLGEDEAPYWTTLGKKLYFIRRSLKVLRKFHWMIHRGRFNQLLHVSSPLMSKPRGRKAHLLKDKQISSVGVFDEVSFYTLFRGIKRCHRNLYGDGVRNLATASGRGQLKEDLESSTWRRRHDFKATSS